MDRIATCRAISAGLLAIAAAGIAHADERGTPFWLSGQFASMAATPETPGWSLSVNPYYYNGLTDSSKRSKGAQQRNSPNSPSPDDDLLDSDAPCTDS